MDVAKKRETNQIDDAAGANKVVKEDRPAPYLKLIGDCWMYIFDNLSFKDIISMGKTCKRMAQMAGYYIREFYPELEFKLNEKHILYQDIVIEPEFYQYIGRLVIRYGVSAVEFFSNYSSFDALKTISLSSITLSTTQIEHMQNVLQNVECILVNGSHLMSNIFERFALNYPKLRQIKVSSDLFSYHFPMLEHLQLDYLPENCTRIDDLKVFIQTHDTLKQFDVYDSFLWINRDVFTNSNFQLGVLCVQFMNLGITIPFDEFMQLLRALHSRGFYKTLQLSISSWIFLNYEQQKINTILSLPELEKLTTARLYCNSTCLSKLQELNIEAFDYFIDVKTWAINLQYIQRLTLCQVDVYTILLFVRHSRWLQTVTIGKLCKGVLDINVLHQARKRLMVDRWTLGMPSTVTIHMADDDYLSSKWKSNSLDLELGLIKIKRYNFFEF